MQALQLEGHYGQSLEADLCHACHLVWFDAFESVRLSGLGWVQLLRAMQPARATGPASATTLLGTPITAWRCTRCEATLKPVHNLTRFGRFAAHECSRQHGHAQTFTLLLAERGLVRALLPRDFRWLRQSPEACACFNCGAPIEQATDACGHCGSPLVVIDWPGLMRALLVRHGEPVLPDAAHRLAWACQGCGAPLDPTRETQCQGCGHPALVPQLKGLMPLLDQAETLLKQHTGRAAKPHGQKLRAMLQDHRHSALHRYMQRWRDGDHPNLVGNLALAACMLLAWWWVR